MGTAQFTPLARNDLQDIKVYISQDNPKTAAQYLGILKQKCDILAQTPTIGVCREEYCNLYKFPVDKYLIFYRITASGIEVIRILHGARDIQSILN
jgi:toxin ParE1/3/4